MRIFGRREARRRAQQTALFDALVTCGENDVLARAACDRQTLELMMAAAQRATWA